MKSVKAKRIIAVIMAVGIVLSFSATAFAAEITTEGGTGTVPVELTTEAPSFSVTVPTSLPVSVDDAGTVVCASSGTAKIVNSSYAAVRVSGLSVSGSNDFVTQDYDSYVVAEASVDAKEIAFTVNDEKTTGSDTISFDQDNWGQIDGANDGDTDELAINYDAKIAPQSSAVSALNVSDVVFTISWAD